jgi:Zn finger protein HypA/HybF involved in hydrogenase expression
MSNHTTRLHRMSASQLLRQGIGTVPTIVDVVRLRVTLRCNECGHTWRVSPNASDPQCSRCNSVDFEVQA